MASNPDGTQKMTAVSGSNTSGLFASDGSWNVVLNASSTASPYGIQHKSGAYNIAVGSDSNYYNPNGSINVTYGAYGYTPISNPAGGSAVTAPSAGSIYLIGADGAYLKGADGAYLLGAA